MKRKQFLALLMAAAMVVSLAACGNSTDSAEEPATETTETSDAAGSGDASAASGDASGNAGGGSSASVSTSGTFDTYLDADGNEIASGDGTKYTTSYLTEDGETGILGSWSGLVGFKYRAGVYVKDGAIDEDNSVYALAGLNGVVADFDDEGITGLDVTTATSGFSAVIVRDSDYTISDANIVMNTDSDGQDVNDFAGYGAAVAVFGDSVVLIENSNIETTGVAKLATFADDGADIIVNNSTLGVNGGDIYSEYKSTANQSLMINPPWVLGISGSARTTNVMGDYTTGTYVDTTIKAANWGAVSIDSGTAMKLTCVNCEVSVDGSGYGAYAIGTGTEEYYLGTTFDVQTYAVILTGATVTFDSYTGGEEIDITKLDDAGTRVATVSSSAVAAGETVNSSVTSANFGFMFHHNASSGTNVLNILNGTTVSTENAVFLIKKISSEINIDSAEVSSADGVILQIIDNDDDMIGAYMDDVFGMPTFNMSFEEPDGWSSTWGVDYVDSGWTHDFNVTNATLNGSLYNGSGYTSNGGATLNVNLGENAVLNGGISATEYQHDYKSFTYRTEAEGYNATTAAEAAAKLGHVTNQVYSNGVNIVNVTLTDNAVWTVTEECYVDSLTIGADATVNATATDANGNEVTLEAGKTYTSLTLNAAE